MTTPRIEENVNEINTARELFKEICKYSGQDECPGCGMRVEQFDELVSMVRNEIYQDAKKKMGMYDWGDNQAIINVIGENILNDILNI